MSLFRVCNTRHLLSCNTKQICGIQKCVAPSVKCSFSLQNKKLQPQSHPQGLSLLKQDTSQKSYFSQCISQYNLQQEKSSNGNISEVQNAAFVEEDGMQYHPFELAINKIREEKRAMEIKDALIGEDTKKIPVDEIRKAVLTVNRLDMYERLRVNIGQHKVVSAMIRDKYDPHLIFAYRDKGEVPEEKIVTALIAGYTKTRRLDYIEEFFQRVERYSVPLPTEAYNHWIIALIQAEEFHRLLYVVPFMEKMGVKPNENTIIALSYGYWLAGPSTYPDKYHKLETKLFDQMLQTGIKYNIDPEGVFIPTHQQVFHYNRNAIAEGIPSTSLLEESH